MPVDYTGVKAHLQSFADLDKFRRFGLTTPNSRLGLCVVALIFLALHTLGCFDDPLKHGQLRYAVTTGKTFKTDENLLQYPSPLGWEDINLTGDYVWRSSTRLGPSKFKPLRPSPTA